MVVKATDNNVPIALVEKVETDPAKGGVSRAGSRSIPWKKVASICVGIFAVMITGLLVITLLPVPGWPVIWAEIKANVNADLGWFLICGFLAQLVDGMLGLGYGLTCATALMAAGVAPTLISSSIHTAELFTSGISGYTHYKFGNVNRRLFKALLIPGLIGAISGALSLVIFGKAYANWVMPILAIYCLFLGIRILSKAFILPSRDKKRKHIPVLAAVGGFLDAFGGGGWGPLVTSTLIARGRNPQYVIGTVNLVEFFITLAAALTFFTTMGVAYWPIMAGLIIGGVLAAPLAARLAGKLPRRLMLICLGIIVILWSLRLISKLLF